jgi:hypothetical protein
LLLDFRLGLSYSLLQDFIGVGGVADALLMPAFFRVGRMPTPLITHR